MSLDNTKVQRHLDAKLKIGGLKAFDLFLTIGIAMIMNFIFEGTGLYIPTVFILPLIVLGLLHFIFSDKPDGYPLHWVRFHTSDGIYLAGMKAEYEEKFYRRPYEKFE